MGPSLIRITISSLFGRHLARSTSLTSSSRLSMRTHGRVRRSSMPAPGCVARSTRPGLARQAAVQWARPETCVGQHGMPRTLLARPAAVAHVAAHELGAAAYAIKAARAAAPEGEGEAAGRLECQWQRDQLPEAIRELVLDDEQLRNDICWSVFDC